MKKMYKKIGIIAVACIVGYMMYSCDGGSSKSANGYYYGYGNQKTNTYDGLSDLQRLEQEAKRAEEDAHSQTVEFLNKAYGYDVSSYVD